MIFQKHSKGGLKRKKTPSDSIAAAAAATSDWWYAREKHTQMTAALETRPSDQLSVYNKEAIHLDFSAPEQAPEKALSKTSTSNFSILRYLFKSWPQKLICF